MPSLETVDIGGAAARGRPPVPPVQTIVFNEKGIVQVDGVPMPSTGEPADLRTVKPTGEVSDRIRRSTGAQTIAYPEEHPANRKDLAISMTGALQPEKGQLISKGPEALGDVRRGYTTGPMGSVQPETRESSPAIPQKESSEKLFAVDSEGGPVIEVLFDTPIGIVASYYQRVVQSGNFLVLVVDNRLPAAQRFIPKPQDTNDKPAPMLVTLTGKDRKSNQLWIIPLGIQFSVDFYDFVVLLIVDPPKKEEVVIPEVVPEIMETFAQNARE